MSNVVWETTYSVETDASLDSAWKYWTNVANSDDPPAKFEASQTFQVSRQCSGLFAIAMPALMPPSKYRCREPRYGLSGGLIVWPTVEP